LYCLSFYLRLLITPLVSCGHCIVCPSIYGFSLPLWYLMPIVLSLLLFTASDYPFGILCPLYCLSFYLRLLITPLVSLNLFYKDYIRTDKYINILTTMLEGGHSEWQMYNTSKTQTNDWQIYINCNSMTRDMKMFLLYDYNQPFIWQLDCFFVVKLVWRHYIDHSVLRNQKPCLKLNTIIINFFSSIPKGSLIVGKVTDTFVFHDINYQRRSLYHEKWNWTFFSKNASLICENELC
jgi:hypothetical protein